MRTLLLCLSLLFCLPDVAEARMFHWKKKKKEMPTAASKPAPKRERRPEPQLGLLGVQHHKDDYYLQVADTLLGWPMLTTTRFVATPVEMGVYGGELVTSNVVYFEKQGERLLLRALMYDATADSTDRISRALAASTENPIVAAFRLDSIGTHTVSDTLVADGDTSVVKHKVYSIKATDFLKGDNIVTGFTSQSKTRFSLGAIKADASYVDYVHTYPTNTEVVSVKTYAAQGANQRSVAGRLTGTMTFRLNTSIVLLPRHPMRPRYFDPRVGYFRESHREYSDRQQQVRRRDMATRWRLEPKDSVDAAAYARGELVEPKKPIVYYIDPATPQQWRPYLIAGVNDWNVAFEQAGWKNAIRAEEWPEADSTMSLEDARYSVIRYLASPISNAYGPHVSDPRSGEILETHIGWYHNVMQLIHDWYIIQAGAVDPRARQMQLPDDLMGELIRFVSSHEVGHTLGLRHNMGASSATPVDSLRSKAWVERHGHTASIMDYARFNYVAQPEDGIGADGIFPRINDYDKWAIEWGYRWFPDEVVSERARANGKPLPADSTESEAVRLAAADAERLLLNAMTVERLAESRRYWFGGEGRDGDPRAQTEDLGDDAMKASDYGIRNLKHIAPQLPEWVGEEGDLCENLDQLYVSLVGQMRRYVGHVARNVAGVYIDYKSVEQSGPVYVPEEKARVRRAMQWLDREVLSAEPTWLGSGLDYVQRLSATPQSRLRSLADVALDALCSSATLRNVATYAYASTAYQPADYAADIVQMLFRETSAGTRLSSWRMYVQRQAVQRLIRAWNQAATGDAHPYATLMLTSIQQRVHAATPADAATRAHYRDIDQQIRLAFDNPSSPAPATSTLRLVP